MRPSFFFWVLGWAGAGGRARAGTIVSGHLTNPQDQRISISLRTDPFTGKDVAEVKGVLDANGDFRLDLTALKQPAEATLRHGEEVAFLFLMPNDDLHLTADGDRFGGSLRFSGRGALANTCLALDHRRFGGKIDAEATTKAQAVR